jgi:hypothetical protein
MQVCKVGVMILDQRFLKRLNPTKRRFVQVRNRNLGHIARSKVIWEQSTWKACSHWRRTKHTNSCCPSTTKRTHSYSGSTSSYGRITFEVKWQDLEADSSTTMIKQAQPYTSEASWQVMIFGSANNTGDNNSGIDVKSDLTASGVINYQTSTIVAGFWILVEYQRYRGLPLLSNRYLRAPIRSMVQELYFIEIDKCCRNSMLVLLAKTHQWASIGNTRAGRPGASIRQPCSSHTPWCWSSLGVPPDLYLVRQVFDVLQLVFCINRHM